MNGLLLAVGLLVAGGLAALALGRFHRLSSLLGAGSAIAGGAAGLASAVAALPHAAAQTVQYPWQLPGGALILVLDPLAVFFLVPTLALTALAALYGFRYLDAYRDRSPGVHWCSFNLLSASMVVVSLAGNALLFLLAWETMALASFFLVAFESERESVRKASWIYLVATQIGTAFLLPLFLILGSSAGSLDFARFPGGLSGSRAALCFVLAFIGFGTKAGIMPFHVWLPEAHPAAPSHVSALMSGVMIKTGIYGLIRVLSFLGAPPLWWGWVLVGAGAVTGVFGVLLALAQHDLKRLLAYHSVENIGIIVLGLGIGLLGVSTNHPAVAAVALGGAVLHVLNHAVFKGLLFLGAGSVQHAAHTREIDVLGGLLKRMPWTGATFLVGAVAISGLPPLNGFVSEFLIYLGAFRGLLASDGGLAVPLYGAVAALALIGGLALACFTKAFGIVFLGEPRSDKASLARESGWPMTVPMVLLAACCVALGLAGPRLCGVAMRAASVLGGPVTSTDVQGASLPLAYVSAGAAGFLLLLAALLALRRGLLRGRAVGTAGTWDCGYAAPTPRMQYTASSFAQPITDLFGPLLRTRKDLHLPATYFPASGRLETETSDVGQDRVYRPAFRLIESLLSRMRPLQQGRIHAYVLYVVLTLIFLLLWKLR